MKHTDIMRRPAATDTDRSVVRDKHWMEALKNERASLKQRRRDSPLTHDPLWAENEVRERQRELSLRAGALEDAFWEMMGGRVQGQTQPFFDRASFSAARCLACPALAAARSWFRVLAEMDAVDRAVKREEAMADTSPSIVLKSVRNIQDDYEMADFVWREHCRCHELFGAEAAERVIADWVVATVGTAYVLPEFRRVSPGAGSAEMLAEIRAETRVVTTREATIRVMVKVRGRVIGELRAVRPDNCPSTDVPVTDVCSLPARVATSLRHCYSDGESDLARLVPATRHRLIGLHVPEPDPQATISSQIIAEEIWEEIKMLPPKQRQVTELFIDGHSREAIAERMGIGQESVKTHLKIARGKIRSAMTGKQDSARRPENGAKFQSKPLR